MDPTQSDLPYADADGKLTVVSSLIFFDQTTFNRGETKARRHVKLMTHVFFCITILVSVH